MPYDAGGKLLWHRLMGPFKNGFGAASSPIIVGDHVIVCQDHDTDSFLTSIDKHNGQTVWRTDRSEFPRSWCTPMIWQVGGRKQIVVAATLRVVGYDFETGAEVWTVRGLSRHLVPTPVIGHDNTLFVAAWSRGGDADSRIHAPPFDTALGDNDANKNGSLQRDELPGGPVGMRFTIVDRDKNGSITREEYEYYVSLFARGRNVILAVRPGGRGDVTDTHVVWESRRHIPEIVSPLFYKDYIFTVRNGGIFTSFDAKTGKPLKTGRVSGGGAYYSSPIAGDGKVYLTNQRGEVTVVSAEGDWKILWKANFGDEVYATPAITESRIYFRTTKNLFCFGKMPRRVP